jgi:putative ABC transport system ATP-binding protein
MTETEHDTGPGTGAQNGQDSVLEAEDVSKFFGTAAGKFAVVREVGFSVPRGKLVTIMGPSGSGKSTLLHMVSGLEPPSGGTILLAGQDLYDMSERSRTLLRRDTIGFVFQFYNLIPNLTVAENIKLPLMIGAGGDELVGDVAEKHFEELIEAFSLENKLANYPHQLSGGEMQRTSIARALIAKPTIVMADEPTGNISTSAGEEVMKLFRRSCDELGQTILLVTHNPRDAGFADEVHFLKDGELHEEYRLEGDAVTHDGIAHSLTSLGI